MSRNPNIFNDAEQSYWNSRYESGETGWDLSEVSGPLKEYFDQVTDKSLSILIPGCGNAHEAEYLSMKGFKNITLLDISEVLINSLKKKFSNRNNIKIINENFFEHKGKYDLIIEQTFFCAIDPSLRASYSGKMKDLLSDNGKLVGVLFDKEFEKEGPPFGGSEKEYRKLFSINFEIETIEKCFNSVSPRNGGEVFIKLKNK